MKNISKKAKIIAILIAIIVIAGIIVIAKAGLNFELAYQETQKIQLYIQKDFEISDIKQIINEVMPNTQTVVQKVEVYKDTVSIIAKEITDEQKSNLINKVNEKYGTEIQAEDIDITNIPHTRGRDIVKPYIIPFVIATAIILVYMAIRYRKLGMIKTLVKTAIILVLAQATLLSIMAITRIPIGKITIPLVLIVYVASLFGTTTKFEKQLLEKNKEE